MSCRWTDAVVAAATGPGAPGLDREARRHIAGCRTCREAIRRAEDLDRALEMDLRPLRTGELPRTVLTARSTARPMHRAWQTSMAMALGAVTVAAAATFAAVMLVNPQPPSHIASGPAASRSPAPSVGASASLEPTPSATPAPAVAGLEVNHLAAVVDEPLVVRSAPGTSDATTITTDRLWKGQRVRLLEGPVEADGYPWWRVRIGEIQGWIASEEKDGSLPWIAPIENGQILYATQTQQLRVVNADGSGDRPFLDQSLTDLRPVLSCGSSVRATWSADGTFAIILDAPACDGSIYRVAADGTAPAFLVDGRDPAIAGDGSRIAFSQNVPYTPCSPDCSTPGHASEIGTISIDGMIHAEVGGQGEPGFVAYGPSWSPDRRSVAYSGYRVQAVRSDGSLVSPDIYVTDADGNRRITSGARPTWSPDGRWIVFGRGRPDGLTELLRIRPDGSGEQSLGLADPATVAISPDGDRLAVVSHPDPDHSFLAVVPFGDQVESGLRYDDGLDPAWSPDGEQLAWSQPAEPGAAPQIWIGAPGGDAQLRVAEGVAPAWQPLVRR